MGDVKVQFDVILAFAHSDTSSTQVRPGLTQE
jgi:hypothetical protein